MSGPSIGILGGIFDPVHSGHLAVAALAREHLGLERVYFVPAGSPPHKSRTVGASRRHRLAMLRLAVSRRRGCAVYTGELNRHGPSYSIDTIRALKRRHRDADLHFIIGSDNLREIRTWHRYREILANVVLCVAHRPGHSLRRPAELRGARIAVFPSPEWNVSSSLIRGYLARGFSCTGLLPDAVRAYIGRNRLYDRQQHPNRPARAKHITCSPGR
jgi:nicotinate-nucleotide adenylyltransferase